MPTPVQDLIPMFDREINGPGFEQITDITGGQKLGYIQDGFWDVRLSGILGSYTIADGADTSPVGTTGTKYFTDTSTKAKSLEEMYWMLIVIFAGFRLLRLKVMNLAVNFKAEAGPVSYEQQASATVLRALLDSLHERLQELKVQYSEDFNASVFILMDGVAQSEYALLAGLADQQIVY